MDNVKALQPQRDETAEVAMIQRYMTLKTERDHLKGMRLPAPEKALIDEERTLKKEIAEFIHHYVEVREITHSGVEGMDLSAEKMAEIHKLQIRNEKVHKFHGTPDENLEELNLRMSGNGHAMDRMHCNGIFLNEKGRAAFTTKDADLPLMAVYVSIAENMDNEHNKANKFPDSIETVLGPDNRTALRVLRDGGALQKVDKYVGAAVTISSFDDDLPALSHVLITGAAEKIRDNLRNETGNPELEYTPITLSPLLTFKSWLDEQLKTRGDELFTREEMAGIVAVHRGAELKAKRTVAESMQELLEDRKFGWTPEGQEFMKKLIEDLAIEYLLTAKDDKDPKRAHNGVAHMHWSNGAGVIDVHFGAHERDNAYQYALSVMVNHDYSQEDLYKGMESYSKDGIITVADPLLERFLERYELRHCEQHNGINIPKNQWDELKLQPKSERNQEYQVAGAGRSGGVQLA